MSLLALRTTIYTERLIQSGQRQRTRHSQLSLSEIMTIIVYFHRSHYRDFKHYYTDLASVLSLSISSVSCTKA